VHECTNKMLQCEVSEGFASWMAHSGGSVAISTYQAGRVVMVGRNGRQTTVLPRQLPRPMGLARNGDVIAIACHHEVTYFANAPVLAPHYPEENCRRYDALYLPRASYLTGGLDVHDIGFAGDCLWVVNTSFSCLSVLSEAFSFIPRWYPPFISQLVPEDRCHLNGLAIVDGAPKFVTAHGMTDDAGGWRANKTNGGVLIEVDSGQCVLTGLSMPHSPRQHDGRLWMLNSGMGELCVVEPEKNRYETVCALPGYVRGLCFVKHYAIVGLSKVRSSHLFEGLPVQERFPELLCGAAVVDLKTGQNLGAFEFTDGCDELYDVLFLPGVSRPSLLNKERLAKRQGVSAPDFAYWLYEDQEKREDQSTGHSSGSGDTGPRPAEKEEDDLAGA